MLASCHGTGKVCGSCQKLSITHHSVTTYELTVFMTHCTQILQHSMLKQQSHSYIVEPSLKDPPRKGQPPNKGRNSEPLSHSSVVPPRRGQPLNRGQITGPKVSFIWRFHCNNIISIFFIDIMEALAQADETRDNNYVSNAL